MPSGALRYLGETIDWRSNLAKRSIPLLIRRLRQAGFGSEFVSAAILPDWWDQSCLNQPELLPEIEIRVGRFLAVPLSTVSDPESTLEPLGYPGARLRCVRDIGHDRLAPAIHAAMRIAGAVVRNLKEPVPARTPPPSDGLAWRQEIRGLDGSLVLDAIVEDLWTRGIPVVPAHLLPTPGFQGLAAVVEDRPVVVLGHRHDEPGRVAFRIAHEAGHIAKGDCTPDAPVVDEDEEILQDDEMEELADRVCGPSSRWRSRDSCAEPQRSWQLQGPGHSGRSGGAGNRRRRGIDHLLMGAYYGRLRDCHQGHESPVPRNRSHPNPTAVLQEVRRRGGRVSE